MLKAFDKLGVEIKPGDTMLDFRGDRAIFVKATREAGSRAGKVVVTWVGDNMKVQREYYDKVFELEVRDIPDDAKEKDRR